LRGLAGYDFSHISSDLVGRIFQRLIGPEERHRWGQHFTGDDIVDFINAFCVRRGDAAILDPACGSGSFLVRAYYRKQKLDHERSHIELLSELYGSDIAAYPAHLATLNLAAREINDERNYPRITRTDFFDVTRGNPFCKLPDNTGNGILEISLPPLDVVVGNPPYVRQEKIGRPAKEKWARLIADRWPGMELAGRSDAHCYFWPAAAYFLKEDGYFGFLTSSSWLDVEYGFPLQRWILENFRIIAICESEAEPWLRTPASRRVRPFFSAALMCMPV
jgi:type I restriction-modification system DNA methylase subunit